MRIAVSGSACQGKTTFIQDFIKEWPMYSTPEKTYREYIEENNLPDSDNTNKDAQWGILNNCVDTLMEYEKGDKVIFDRCPLDNIVYSLWAHEKGINDIDKKFIDKCIPVVRESLKFLDVIFFTPITKVGPVDLVDDGTRSINKEHVQEIDNIFKGMEQQYFQNLKGSTFLPYDDCPAIVEIFGNERERVYLARQYIDAEGDLLGDNNSTILDPEDVTDMENILRDQQIEIAKEKIYSDNIYKKIQDSRRY
jgi:hypothetical protein